MQKIIVTGGAGFIGSHITDLLIENNYEVHVIDNLTTGKKENINKKAVFHEIDIRNLSELKPVFENAYAVFHEAAFPRVQPSIEDPITTQEINVNGTLNVLVAARDAKIKRLIYAASSSAYGDQEKFPLIRSEDPITTQEINVKGALNVLVAARDAKIKRLIYAASSSAYGDQEKFPLIEDMQGRPLSPYGLQKYTGELMCRLFSDIYGLETVSLRYFNVYGPRASDEGAYALVIAKFLKQRKEGTALTIVPDGNQSRAYTHVKDVARANFSALNSEKVGKGEVINIGGVRDYSVNFIADLIGGEKIFIEPRIEPRKTVADISFAKKLLGWEPEIEFTKGVSELKSIYHV